jgi:hypothetical protein
MGRGVLTAVRHGMGGGGQGFFDAPERLDRGSGRCFIGNPN